jgi:glutathionyl-hydroquinone reductase
MSTANLGARTRAAQDARFIPRALLRWELGGGRVLRLADPSEFVEVAEVLHAAFSNGCWVTPSYREHLGAIGARAVTAHVWVVADAQGVLGAVLTPKPEYHREADFTFNILGVGTRGRGLNLGWQLTDHSVALARAFGYRRLEIRSSPQMTAAHQLYYRYGFVRRPDWETSVVDSGQRLLAFTYRVTDPAPHPQIPAEDPPVRRSYSTPPQEPEVNLINHLPAGTHDSTGDFRPTPAERPGPVLLDPQANYRLVTSLDALRGRAALVARRLAGAQAQIEVVEHPDVIAPRLYDAAGELISDDWRFLARAILDLTEHGHRLYPDELASQIDVLDLFIHADVIGGLERAIFAGSDTAGRIAQRLVYARLGDLDQRLAHQRYLLGESLSEADIALFAVLIGFDLEYRGQLGWGAASLVDYPNLWAYARGLLQTPDFADDAELIALGLLPGEKGEFVSSWGEPLPVEGVADLRSAWLDGDDRELGAA